MAVFKVFFQHNKNEVIVRENTNSIYVEGETEEQVRRYLKDRNYNIEFITKLEGAHLEYEKEHSNHFNVENAQ
ncbi:DUF1447 family protein [Staphylococcus devriesei]|uniref:DNA-directed RNA polymerase subunit epsilon n=1 Tax=Staphylococcus devriesei TaxID=586733 RepID=A0A2K4DM92_9STAP|nr:DNA-dependent RNA polymerase subunit epsilon [Staphylococcus devriesei]MCE5089388.1 DNA-dependent RNA polymerase auxiliary subunit epsilon family protein [Staphylococcus devriesei]MCE5096362.1 DNA-dependent RNA polymerase auxiliary subunit epsilon family protein [Staphylococcus devriesei]PNZ87604.1 hypothetical protein CD147_07165 [Staphylococcus devriesei]PTE74532.1 hypothetical protein BUY44_00825 [Staphylococcus devriesei]PTF03321.1 hypothetical protein BUY45_09025 [Staphylococcus devrie